MAFESFCIDVNGIRSISFICIRVEKEV